MTHLNITLDTGYIEEVNSSIISKLYKIASSGDLDLTSNLIGRLHTSLSYRDESEYLTTTYPNLFISSDEYSIRFEDPNMLTFLLLRGIGSNGVITESLAAAALMASNTSNNVVVKFNELRYFTKITESAGGFEGILSGKCFFYNWLKLEEIDISNFTSIGHNNGNGWLDSFLNCISLKTVTASNKLLALGSEAFRECSKLETISGLSGEIILCYGVFRGCSKLTSDNFEDVEFIIGTLPLSYGLEFYLCTSLTEITCSSKSRILYQTFYGCTNLETINGLSNITTIYDSPFFGCPNLQTVDLDYSKIETISGNNTFYRPYSYDLPSTISLSSLLTLSGINQFNSLTSLNTITSLGSITTIPQGCFSTCMNLLSVALPNTLETIASNAFDGCTYLETVSNFENCNLKSIGSNAFRGCRISNSITFNEGLETIGVGAFYNNRIPSIVFPSTLKVVGNFRGNSLLTTVTFKEGLETLDDYAFQNCSSLTAITFPSTLKSIGYICFGGCTSLTTVTFSGNTLENISRNTSNNSITFLNCTSLTTLNNFPSIEYIPGQTFSGCPISNAIVFKEGVVEIGYLAFRNNRIPSLTFPSSLRTIGALAFNGNLLTSITFNEGVEIIKSEAFGGCNQLTTLTFPNSLKTVQDSAFTGCLSLTTLNLGQVEIIGSQAFWQNHITSITLPNTLKEIYLNAFGGTSNATYALEKIIVPEGCYKATANDYYSAGIKYIELPSTITNMERFFQNAFIWSANVIIVLKAATPPLLGLYSSDANVGYITYDINDPNAAALKNSFLAGISRTYAVYVPDVVLTDYQAATGAWLLPELQAKLKPISDLLTDNPTYWAVYQAGLSTP